MGFLDRGALKRIHRALGRYFDRGEKVLGFDSGTAKGLSIDVVATTRGLYMLEKGRPSNVLRVLYSEMVAVDGGRSWLSFRTKDDSVEIDFGLGPLGLDKVVGDEFAKETAKREAAAAKYRAHLDELRARDMYPAESATLDDVLAWRDRMRERFPQGISPEVDFEAIARTVEKAASRS